MADVILGVDGGSTKTHVALADRAGRLLALAEGGSCNHEGRGFPPVRDEFRRLLARACRAAGVSPRDVRAACLGLSGCDIPADGPQLQRHVIRPLGLGGPAAVFNDAFIPLFHDRWRDRGVVVTSGSWHKWLAANGRRTFMHDGLHTTGLRELAAFELTRVVEGYRTPSPFTRAMVRFLGFRSERDFWERWHFGRGKRAFVAPVRPAQERAFRRLPEFLARASARGSREARRVLSRYAVQLVEGARAVVRAVGLDHGPFDAILSGSVLAGIPFLRAAFARGLAPLAPGARVLPARARPIRGALVYAARLAGWRLPARALRDPRLAYR